MILSDGTEFNIFFPTEFLTVLCWAIKQMTQKQLFSCVHRALRIVCNTTVVLNTIRIEW